MPADLKEVHFFDREEMFRGDKPDYEKYHAHFHPEPQHRMIGEASPIYMYWTNAPNRIWSYSPEMKWILILRNPVDRAYSAWNMERQRGADSLSFEEAIAQEAERCRLALPLQHRVFSYTDRGFYAPQIRRLFNIFGRERCHIILNSELQERHASILQNVFRFLEVDDSVKTAEQRVFEHDYEKPMDAGVRARLIEMFYFDIRELERMLGRDLSEWYTSQSKSAG